MEKTGEPQFKHKGIRMNVNAEVIAIGLKNHIKDYFIEELGRENGIDGAYQAFKRMYAENTGDIGLPDKLTDEGRELINIMLVDGADALIADDCETLH